VAQLVVFVHGTGVREEGWANSFKTVRQRLRALDSSITVHGCFWGRSDGAQLNAHGASVPDYANTHGAGVSDEDEDLALWAVLYTDPWYEIRLLSDWPAAGGELAPGQVPPSAVLSAQVQNFEPSAGLSQLLSDNELDPYFDEACAQLRDAPEFARLTAAVTDENLNEFRKALARALVACTLLCAQENGAVLIDGATRDLIVAAVITDLHGYGMGIAGWLSRPFKGLAEDLVTRLAARRRGALTDATSPVAGDIMRYQSRGSGVRSRIRQVVADAVAGAPDQPVTLLAHSLGGVACVDALIEAPVPGVERLITVGSQAPFFYEIDALDALTYGKPLPGHFPAWLNIYDMRDFLSYIAAGVFPGRVTDQCVDNGQPFPQAHITYWRNDAVWENVKEFLG
jgi:hypothetical protein